jgi:hypothetical protein
MLDRYKKAGGFIQLLMLVETSSAAKRDKFLELIESEDVVWAQSIRDKMLSIDRIFSWKDETLAEIFGTLQDLTVAVVLSDKNEAFKHRIYPFFTNSRRLKIDELLTLKAPSAAEVTTMYIKILETTRKMATQGVLRFEKIDPALAIPDHVEDYLAKVAYAKAASAPNLTSTDGLKVVPATVEQAPDAKLKKAKLEVDMNNIGSLRRAVVELKKENAVLREELEQALLQISQNRKKA